MSRLAILIRYVVPFLYLISISLLSGCSTENTTTANTDSADAKTKKNLLQLVSGLPNSDTDQSEFNLVLATDSVKNYRYSFATQKECLVDAYSGWLEAKVPIKINATENASYLFCIEMNLVDLEDKTLQFSYPIYVNTNAYSYEVGKLARFLGLSQGVDYKGIIYTSQTKPEFKWQTNKDFVDSLPSVPVFKISKNEDMSDAKKTTETSFFFKDTFQAGPNAVYLQVLLKDDKWSEVYDFAFEVLPSTDELKESFRKKLVYDERLPHNVFTHVDIQLPEVHGLKSVKFAALDCQFKHVRTDGPDEGVEFPLPLLNFEHPDEQKIMLSKAAFIEASENAKIEINESVKSCNTLRLLYEITDISARTIYVDVGKISVQSQDIFLSYNRNIKNKTNAISLVASGEHLEKYEFCALLEDSPDSCTWSRETNFSATLAEDQPEGRLSFFVFARDNSSKNLVNFADDEPRMSLSTIYDYTPPVPPAGYHLLPEREIAKKTTYLYFDASSDATAVTYRCSTYSESAKNWSTESSCYSGKIFTFNQTGRLKEQQKIRVRAIDENGNSSSSVHIVYFDYTAPEVDIRLFDSFNDKFVEPGPSDSPLDWYGSHIGVELSDYTEIKGIEAFIRKNGVTLLHETVSYDSAMQKGATKFLPLPLESSLIDNTLQITLFVSDLNDNKVELDPLHIVYKGPNYVDNIAVNDSKESNSEFKDDTVKITWDSFETENIARVECSIENLTSSISVFQSAHCAPSDVASVALTDEGQYVFRISPILDSGSAAGSYEFSFIIDRTAPVIALEIVQGIDGANYDTAVIDFTKKNALKYAYKFKSNEFISGRCIGLNDSYEDASACEWHFPGQSPNINLEFSIPIGNDYRVNNFENEINFVAVKDKAGNIVEVPAGYKFTVTPFASQSQISVRVYPYLLFASVTTSKPSYNNPSGSYKSYPDNVVVDVYLDNGVRLIESMYMRNITGSATNILVGNYSLNHRSVSCGTTTTSINRSDWQPRIYSSDNKVLYSDYGSVSNLSATMEMSIKDDFGIVSKYRTSFSYRAGDHCFDEGDIRFNNSGSWITLRGETFYNKPIIDVIFTKIP